MITLNLNGTAKFNGIQNASPQPVPQPKPEPIIAKSVNPNFGYKKFSFTIIEKMQKNKQCISPQQRKNHGKKYYIPTTGERHFHPIEPNFTPVPVDLANLKDIIGNTINKVWYQIF